MGSLRYCARCGKDVATDMKVNWVILIVLLLLNIALGAIYFVYCIVSNSHKKCPYCGSRGKELEAPRYGERQR